MEAVTVWILVGALVILYIIHFIRCNWNRKHYPPGPIYIPFVGCFLHLLWAHPVSLQAVPWIMFDNLRKYYGDVYMLRHNNIKGLILCSYEAHTDLLDMEEVSGKIDLPVTRRRTFNKELGLIFVSTPKVWHEMRKFTIRTLRDFGFGRTLSMQGVIEAELTDLEREWTDAVKLNNGMIRMDNNFMLSILNVTWTMVSGIRYEHDNKRLVHLTNLTHQYAKMGTLANPVYLFNNILDYLPFIPMNNVLKFLETIHDFTREVVEERRRQGIYKINPENYLDVFLQKIDAAVAANDKNTVYTDEQLIIMIEDLWFVSTMTTSATMSYALLYMILNPEVQKRVQAEIDAVVLNNMYPTLDDLERMPYTQATMLEIHRLAKVVPIPIPRMVMSDIQYKGWKIPKGTFLISNHYSFLMDPKIWGDPEKFRPERFLNDKGEFVPDKKVAVFGFGKRYCMGVALAKSVLPIYLTSLLRRFTFSVVPGQNPPSDAPEVGINLSPYPYTAYVTLRN